MGESTLVGLRENSMLFHRAKFRIRRMQENQVNNKTLNFAQHWQKRIAYISELPHPNRVYMGWPPREFDVLSPCKVSQPSHAGKLS